MSMYPQPNTVKCQHFGLFVLELVFVLGNEVQIYFKLLYCLPNFSVYPEFGVCQSHSRFYTIY